nr:immunoglobulin heavy chain junction region [Macaca mulatta]
CAKRGSSAWSIGYFEFW